MRELKDLISALAPSMTIGAIYFVAGFWLPHWLNVVLGMALIAAFVRYWGRA